MLFSDRLAHLPGRKQRELQRIAQILFAEFDAAQAGKLSEKRRGGRILKLILFGSHARGDWIDDHANGYRSDYDLLVVVNTDAFAEDFDAWDSAQERFDREVLLSGSLATPVGLVAHSYGDLNDRLSRGLPFFVDIARDGIVLQEVEGFPLASPRPLSPEERRAVARGYVEDWLPSAQRRFEIGRDSVARGYSKEAAFDLHQATERFYHSFLLGRMLYSPKLHNIKRLRSLTEGMDARMIAAWPRDTRFARRAFSRLREAYVNARYSPHYEITQDELAWLVERIARLEQLVETLCHEHLDRLSK
jgi:predicted nucleotidyltransferase/HEPN domain-containing protein